MNSIVLQRYFVLTYLSVHTKHLFIKGHIMEKTIQSISKNNTVISCLSIWIPVCLLFIETSEKSFGQQNWFLQILIKANPKFWLSLIVFVVVLRAFGLFLKLKGNEKSKTVDLYLNNNFKMVSQKLFSCLVTMAGILFLTNDNNASSFLVFLLSTSITNAVSFWLLYVMTDNKKKKKKKKVYYFWIAMCMATNLLSTALFFLSAVILTGANLLPLPLPLDWGWLFKGYWGIYFAFWVTFSFFHITDKEE